MTRPLLPLALDRRRAISQRGAGSILPTHIHDAERAALTAKLVATLDAYNQSSPTAYEALVKSTRALAAEQDKVLVELSDNRAAAFEAQLPFQTYDALNKERATIVARLTRVEDKLVKGINRYLIDQKAAAGDAATAAKAIRDANGAVERAKEEVTSWNASIAVLQAGIANLPAIAGGTADDTSAKGLGDLTERLRAVGDKEVEFVDANGVTQKGKIRDVLPAQLRGVATGKAAIPDAPGATLTILTLGVDLARTQKERADARLVQLVRRYALYERVLSETVLARALVEEVAFVGRSASVPVQQDAVKLAFEARLAESDRDALRSDSDDRIQAQFAESNKNMLALANVLLNVRKLAVADSMSIRAELGLDRNTARLAHEESLLDAQVNDREWKAVLRAGVAVLNQYEQGGFTREDAANIIRIAQTIALGVIAGKVD